MLNAMLYQTNQKPKQLGHLHSEDTPRRLMNTHIIE